MQNSIKQKIRPIDSKHFSARNVAVLILMSLVSSASFGFFQSEANDLPQQATALIDLAPIESLQIPQAESRDNLVDSAEANWQSKAVCTVVKSNLENAQQPRVLETCHFANPVNVRVCEANPATVTLHFLENELAQIIFGDLVLSDIADKQLAFRQCMVNLAQNAGYELVAGTNQEILHKNTEYQLALENRMGNTSLSVNEYNTIKLSNHNLVTGTQLLNLSM